MRIQRFFPLHCYIEIELFQVDFQVGHVLRIEKPIRIKLNQNKTPNVQ